MIESRMQMPSAYMQCEFSDISAKRKSLKVIAYRMNITFKTNVMNAIN